MHRRQPEESLDGSPSSGYVVSSRRWRSAFGMRECGFAVGERKLMQVQVGSRVCDTWRGG
jgi:hypothetical protein